MITSPEDPRRLKQGALAISPSEALVCLLRGGVEHGTLTPVEQLLQGDWTAVVEEAIRHEVEALLYVRLDSLPPGARLPSAFTERLAELYARSALHNRFLYDQLSELLQAYTAAGLEVIVLKGAYLAEVVYGDITLRPMADLDLLVRQDELSDAADVLRAVGYEPDKDFTVEDVCSRGHHLPKFRKGGGSAVELHWTLERPDRRLKFDIEGLWKRARPAVIAGRQALALSPADLLLHLCLHPSYHHRFGIGPGHGIALKYLLDVALVIDRYGDDIDGQEFASRANQMGGGRYVYCTLCLVKSLLGTSVPDEWLRRLDHSDADARIVDELETFVLSRPEVEIPMSYGGISRSAGIRKKVLRLATTVAPPPGRLRSIYGLSQGDPRVFFYYFWRPVDLIRRHAGIVYRMIAGESTARRGMIRERAREAVRSWLAQDR